METSNELSVHYLRVGGAKAAKEFSTFEQVLRFVVALQHDGLKRIADDAEPRSGQYSVHTKG